MQADVLTQTGEWADARSPLRDIDESNAATLLPGVVETADGPVYYRKHPLYPSMLRWALEVEHGPRAVSLVAGWLAAVSAMVIARRIGGAERVTLWGVGLATPLFFYANLVKAHTIGAACVGLAVAALLTLRGRTLVALVAPVVAGCFLAFGVLFRSEVVLAVAALAVAALLTRRLSLVGAAAMVATPAVVFLLERELVAGIAGSGGVASPSAGRSGSFLMNQLGALRITSLRTGYGAGGPFDQLVIVWVLGAMGLVVVSWVRPVPARAWTALGGFGVTVYVLPLLTDDVHMLPGLLIACPLLIVAAGFGRRVASSPSRDAEQLANRRFVALAVTGIVVLVAATQYPEGGGYEWGGRFFAVALPLLVPLAVARLWENRDRFGDLALLCFALMASATFALSVTQQREVRGSSADLRHAVEAAIDEAGDDAVLDGRTVVVGHGRLLPEILWPLSLDAHWLMPNCCVLDEYVAEIDTLDIGAVVVIGQADPAERDALAHWDVSSVHTPEGEFDWPVYVLRSQAAGEGR